MPSGRRSPLQGCVGGTRCVWVNDELWETRSTQKYHHIQAPKSHIEKNN